MTKKPDPERGKTPIVKPLPRTRRPDPKRPLGPKSPEEDDPPSKEGDEPK